LTFLVWGNNHIKKLILLLILLDYPVIIKRAARKNDPLAKNYGPW